MRKSRPRALAGSSGPGLRLLELGISAILDGILVFASVTRVQSGHVGVLTLFGRVTGEVLPEGMHMINPLKSNNEMSIRTQEIKESERVPSAEGLVMNLDTSLIYTLEPVKVDTVYQMRSKKPNASASRRLASAIFSRLWPRASARSSWSGRASKPLKTWPRAQTRRWS